MRGVEVRGAQQCAWLVIRKLPLCSNTVCVHCVCMAVCAHTCQQASSRAEEWATQDKAGERTPTGCRVASRVASSLYSVVSCEQSGQAATRLRHACSGPARMCGRVNSVTPTGDVGSEQVQRCMPWLCALRRPAAKDARAAAAIVLLEADRRLLRGSSGGAGREHGASALDLLACYGSRLAAPPASSQSAHPASPWSSR